MRDARLEIEPICIHSVRIELGPRCVIAQEAYLCTGTHDFDDPTKTLLTASITVGTDAFVGARAFVMPGIRIGDGAIVGACSLVTRDVADGTVVAGSPARPLRSRGETPLVSEDLEQKTFSKAC